MTDKTKLFKQCMGKFTTGITVVTTQTETNKLGVTINSFNSVSLNPLLILFSLKKQSCHYQHFLQCKNFTVNILSNSQEKYVNLFASHNIDTWSHVELDTKNPITNSPALKNCLAFLECEIYAKYDGGDHTIIVGKVINLINNENNNPLVYYRGEFLTYGN
ncbi:MAG: flavin reductase family protein [Rickettsiales bacterium]|nr:flavin reductase family protein [Rickettsiales bacterium]